MKSIIFLLLISQFVSAGTLQQAGGRADGSQLLNDGSRGQLIHQHKTVDLTSLSEVEVNATLTRRYNTATGIDFNPRTSLFEGDSSGHGDRSCKNGSLEQFIDHEIKINHGDILTRFDLWGYDDHETEDMAAIVYRQCFPHDAAADPISDVILMEDLPEDGGHFFYSKNLNWSMSEHTAACKLMARIRYGHHLNGHCSGLWNMKFYKFRVEIIENDLIYKNNMEHF